MIEKYNKWKVFIIVFLLVAVGFFVIADQIVFTNLHVEGFLNATNSTTDNLLGSTNFSGAIGIDGFNNITVNNTFTLKSNETCFIITDGSSEIALCQ